MTEASTTQSLDEINAAIAELQEKARALRDESRLAAIAMCNGYIKEFRISAAELEFAEVKANKKRKPKEPREPKEPTHRGPNGEVWTESPKGRKPNWVKALIAGGGDLEQYRIPAQV